MPPVKLPFDFLLDRLVDARVDALAHDAVLEAGRQMILADVRADDPLLARLVQLGNRGVRTDAGETGNREDDVRAVIELGQRELLALFRIAEVVGVGDDDLGIRVDRLDARRGIRPHSESPVGCARHR